MQFAIWISNLCMKRVKQLNPCIQTLNALRERYFFFCRVLSCVCFLLHFFPLLFLFRKCVYVIIGLTIHDFHYFLDSPHVFSVAATRIFLASTLKVIWIYFCDNFLFSLSLKFLIIVKIEIYWNRLRCKINRRFRRPKKKCNLKLNAMTTCNDILKLFQFICSKVECNSLQYFS